MPSKFVFREDVDVRRWIKCDDDNQHCPFDQTTQTNKCVLIYHKFLKFYFITFFNPQTFLIGWMSDCGLTLVLCHTNNPQACQIVNQQTKNLQKKQLTSIFNQKTLGDLCENDDHWVRVMVFNSTFNNISSISRRLVLLVKENGENHRPDASH